MCFSNENVSQSYTFDSLIKSVGIELLFSVLWRIWCLCFDYVGRRNTAQHEQSMMFVLCVVDEMLTVQIKFDDKRSKWFSAPYRCTLLINLQSPSFRYLSTYWSWNDPMHFLGQQHQFLCIYGVICWPNVCLGPRFDLFPQFHPEAMNAYSQMCL